SASARATSLLARFPRNKTPRYRPCRRARPRFTANTPVSRGVIGPGHPRRAPAVIRVILSSTRARRCSVIAQRRLEPLSGRFAGGVSGKAGEGGFGLSGWGRGVPVLIDPRAGVRAGGGRVGGRASRYISAWSSAGGL